MWEWKFKCLCAHLLGLSQEILQRWLFSVLLRHVVLTVDSHLRTCCCESVKLHLLLLYGFYCEECSVLSSIMSCFYCVVSANIYTSVLIVINFYFAFRMCHLPWINVTFLLYTYISAYKVSRAFLFSLWYFWFHAALSLAVYIKYMLLITYLHN